MLRFVCPLFVVDDIAVSRRFYEDALGQTVAEDHGENVVFEGGFAIHLKSHFQRLLGGQSRFPVVARAHDAELYFETDDLEAAQTRLTEAGAESIHPVREQPWGQRVLRCYDPDGHIVEVGESMATVDRGADAAPATR